MRVYLSKLPYNLPEKVFNLKRKKEYLKTLLISDEGIFLVNHDSISKFYFKDKNSFKINVGKNELICDDSYVTKQRWSKIPLNFEMQKRKVVEFLDYKNFKITVEYDLSNKIKDIYFDTNDYENLNENLNTLYFD